MRAVICTKDDIGELMEFMRHKWSANQMISTNRDFVDYHFYDETLKRYNIIYARDENGICGFITFVPSTFYDGEIKNNFVWLINWLVDESADGGTGIMLFMKVRSVTKCKNFGTVGQNKTAEALYEKMGFTIGSLEHYYIAAQTAKKRILTNYVEEHTCQTYEIAECTGFSELTKQELLTIEQHSMPQKSPSFIINKYLNSPYYKYMILGVRGDLGELKGAAVVRHVTHNNSGCLRLIEYFGDADALKNKEHAFKKLLSDFNAEYIDMYCYGISEDILAGAGFKKKLGNVIVPNYFEPFVNENIDIRFAYKFENGTGGFTIFKGDGDRDFKRKTGDV